MKTIWLQLIILKVFCFGFSPITIGNEKPNFIIIVSESHSTSAVGSYKGYLSDINPTPNLDLISQKSALVNKENEINKKIDVLINKLNNPNYIKKAPKDIVLNDKKLLNDLRIEQTKLKSIVSSII